MDATIQTSQVLHVETGRYS